MARRKSTLKQQRARVAKKINATINAVTRIQKSTLQIAQEGQSVAKQTLASVVSSSDFTQKHGEALVEEIGISKFSANGYQVFAPISGDNEIRNEMYFAEYGAGLGASVAKSTPTGVAGYNYIPQFVIQEGEHAGYWFYPLLEPRPYVNKEGELKMSSKGFTNTSVAANYMWSAREKMKQLLNAEISKCSKKIGVKFKRLSPNTNITRPKG